MHLETEIKNLNVIYGYLYRVFNRASKKIQNSDFLAFIENSELAVQHLEFYNYKLQLAEEPDILVTFEEFVTAYYCYIDKWTYRNTHDRHKVGQ